MTIKHLVISGGGPSMIQTIGSIQVLEESKYIELQNIETIYGTSAGAIVGTLICLKYDWDTINDYVIRRPWHEVFPIKVQHIFDAYTKKGIFDIKTIEKCFKPLLSAKDISMEVTLKEFYEYSKIEQHFFVFEINHFKLEDISYLTHPDMSLMQAIQMTCAVPILVTPVCIDGKCYIDGAIICNYPVKYCLESGKNEDEVVGFKNQYDNNTNHVNSESTLLDFILCFLFKVIHSLSIDHTQPSLKHEVVSKTNFLSIDVFRTALCAVETRKELYQQGVACGKEFLEKKLQDSV